MINGIYFRRNIMSEILPVKASTSYIYEPDLYIECCEEDGEEPTQTGFLDFILEDAMEDLNDGSPDLEIISDLDEDTKNTRTAMNIAQQQVLDIVVSELFIASDDEHVVDVEDYAIEVIDALKQTFLQND